MFNIFKKKKTQIITRIAPSPTGNLHIGTARTALFNYLFARKFDGKFIVRIEDTDKERSKKEYEKNILEGLDWLNLEYDELYRQSERTDIYKKYIDLLLKNRKAYVSKEEEGERKEVIRFKNPNKTITFNDEVRGEIKFNTEELGDFVVAKSLDEPLYHLAVVIDDFEMGITHVIRGEDGISNTPRQILIQEAINAPRPVYAHLPLILGEDKSKLSKRHGAASISDFKNDGYLSQAIINFLGLLGWNPGNNREIFGIEELKKFFNLSQIQKGGAVFNINKLNWFNKEYLKNLSDEEFCDCILEKLEKLNIDGEKVLKLKPVILERITKLSEVDEMISSGELSYLEKEPEYEFEKLSWKNVEKETTITHLKKVKEILENISEEEFNKENIKAKIWPYADEVGRGEVLWPLRYTLTGKDKSPDPFEVAGLLGKEVTINRIANVIQTY